MGTLEVFLLISSIIVGGFYLWTFTKSGKKWLSEL